jgi:hypothetical protein
VVLAQSPDEPETKSAFMREVEEELSYDRMMGFLRNHGRKVALALGLGLVALGGGLWYQSHQVQLAGEQGEQFSAALKELAPGGDPTGVPAKLALLATSGNPGYRAAAKFLKADMALEKRDQAGAVAAYRDVLADTGVDASWHDAAQIRLTAAEFDTLAPDVIIYRLKPLAVAGKPWFGTAGEMLAMAYLHQGKRDLAGKLFADIASDKTVPESITDRARQMASNLGVEVPGGETKGSPE